jgi:hypothetical protein
MPAQLPDLRPPKVEPKDKAKSHEDEKQKVKDRKPREENTMCVLLNLYRIRHILCPREV